MNKPMISVHSPEHNAANRKLCYMVHIHLHEVSKPLFRVALLSGEEREKLKEAMRRMQIGSAPRLKEFYILPEPPVFNDVDKLIADIVAVEHERGNESQ